jgi:hypothetical protein
MPGAASNVLGGVVSLVCLFAATAQQSFDRWLLPSFLSDIE